MANRRRNTWHSGQETVQVGSGLQASIDLMEGAALPTDGMTVTRILLSMTIDAQDDETAGDEADLTYGIVMVNLDAFNANMLPDPDEPDQVDWLLLGHARVKAAAVTGREGVASYIYRTYDLGAMRKFGTREDVLTLIFNNTIVAAALDIEVRLTSRVLCKMP